jgi:hypothetical protein
MEMPEIQFTNKIPDSTRAGGRHGGTNAYQQFMIDMPAPARGRGKNAETEYAWFFVPAEISDTISDEDERAKAQKANTQKLVNRFTSVSRRIRKHHGETHDYTFRKARDPNGGEDGAWGIVVYRIEPGLSKGGPGSASQS